MTRKDFDAEELRRLNDQDRMWFVRYWAEYVRTHDDRDWSKQQKILIDSQLASARQFPLTREQYLQIKAAGKKKQ